MTALVGFGGLFVYLIAFILTCIRQVRKVGLVLVFPAIAMISYPYVVMYGWGLLIPVVTIELVALFAIWRIWND